MNVLSLTICDCDDDERVGVTANSENAAGEAAGGMSAASRRVEHADEAGAVGVAGAAAGPGTRTSRSSMSMVGVAL